MGLTPRDHTSAVLKRMNLSGSVPGNLDRDKDATGDNYGLTAARSSDASSFKMTGAPKSPHLGRPGRAAGGRISGNLQRTRRTTAETAADIASEDKVANELGKDRATGGRIDRAYGGHADAKQDRALVGKMVKPSAMRAKGGRIGRDAGGPVERTWGYAPPGDTWRQPMHEAIDADNARDADFESGQRMMNRGVDRLIGSDTGRPDTDRDRLVRQNNAKGGRVGRARGGRTAKGKTTVNVIIGGDKQGPPATPPPMAPPPMAASGPVGPPPRPPMPPPGMGPGGLPGGAPMGPGGPPPGMPPMPRARGGRIGRQFGGGMAPPPGSAGPGGPGAAGMAPPQGAAPAGPPAFTMPGGGAMPAQPGPPPGYTPAPVGAAAAQAGQNMGGPPQISPQMQAMIQAAQAGPPPMPQRARGGRIEISTPGKHDYGKAGVKHGSTHEKYGGGSGLGRQERARHQK